MPQLAEAAGARVVQPTSRHRLSRPLHQNWWSDLSGAAKLVATGTARLCGLVIYGACCATLWSGVEGLVADNHARSVAKAVSWRVTGTIDTFVIAWLITGRAAAASGIAATEVFTKIVLLYLHERGWNLIHWGRPA